LACKGFKGLTLCLDDGEEEVVEDEPSSYNDDEYHNPN